MFGRFLRGVTGDHGFSSPSSATSFARSLSRSSRDLTEQVRGKLSPRRSSGKFTSSQVTAVAEPSGAPLVETKPSVRAEPEVHAHEEEDREGEKGGEEEAREGGRYVESRLKQTSPRVVGGIPETSAAHFLEDQAEEQEAEEGTAVVEACVDQRRGREPECLEAQETRCVNDPEEPPLGRGVCGTNGGTSVSSLSIETRPTVDGAGDASSATTPEPPPSVEAESIIWPALPPMRWDSESPVRKTIDTAPVDSPPPAPPARPEPPVPPARPAPAAPPASNAAEFGIKEGAVGRARKELEKSRSMAGNRGRARREDEHGGGGGLRKSGGASSPRDSVPSSPATGKGAGRRVGRTRTRGEVARSSAGAPEAKRSENDGVNGLRKSGLQEKLPTPAAEEEKAVGDGERGEAVHRAGSSSSATVPLWDDAIPDRGTGDESSAPAAVAAATATTAGVGSGHARGNDQLPGSTAVSNALKSPGGVPSESEALNDSDRGNIKENRDGGDRDPGFAGASVQPHSDVLVSGSVEVESGCGGALSALATEEVDGEDRGDVDILRVPDSDAGDVCNRELGPGLEGTEEESWDARSEVVATAASSACADFGLPETEVEAAAVAEVTPVGNEDLDAGGDDGLTATFHAHLTPALCEVRDKALTYVSSFSLALRRGRNIVGTGVSLKCTLYLFLNHRQHSVATAGDRPQLFVRP